MLNEYVTKKTNMSTILKNVDETMKLKRLGLDTSANLMDRLHNGQNFE